MIDLFKRERSFTAGFIDKLNRLIKSAYQDQILSLT